MTTYLKTGFACAALFALSACGGATTGGGATGGGGVSEFADTRDALVAQRIEGRDLDLTETANIPTGNATFDGGAPLAELSNGTFETVYTAIGTSSVVVNFDTRDVTGTVTDFYEIPNVTLDGEVVDELEAIDPTDATAIDGEITFTASIDTDGTITSSYSGGITKTTGEAPEFDLTASDVDLLGPTGDFLAIEADGSSSANGRDDRYTAFATFGKR